MAEYLVRRVNLVFRRREDKFRVIAAVFFAAVLFIALFSASIDTDAFTYNGASVPLPVVIVIAGVLMAFFIWIIPTLGQASKRLLELIRAWKR